MARWQPLANVRTRGRLLLVGCLIDLFLRTTPVEVQTTGQIVGVVRDQSGAVIAAADVTVIGQGTGMRRTARTNETGSYTAALLPPGQYDVHIAVTGFQPVLVSNVRVAITETTTIDAEVTPASVVESVTVSAGAPIVQTAGPQLGRVVDSRALSGLPLATRNVTQILGLSPGAATYLPDNTAVGRNTQTISVNGARVTENNLQIDGIDVNTMGSAAAVNIPVPAPESIQEYKVQTSLYDATFGRSGGGNVQILTKSGTNTFRGVVYDYLRNDALNAIDPFLKAAGVPRPVLRRNALGGTLGGPLKPNRMFFFLAYQGTRETNGASILNSVSRNVLVTPGLTDDRSTIALTALSRALGLGGAVSPIAAALLQATLPNGQFLIPTPQASGRYTASAMSHFREDQFNVSLDDQVTRSNSLAVRAFVANAPSTVVLPSFRGTAANVPGFGLDQRNDNRVFVLRDVHTFRSSLLNEARVGYAIHRNSFVPQEPVTDAEVGIRRSNADAFPGLSLIRIAPDAGGVVIGTQTNIAPAFPSVTTVADTMTLTRGRQTLRAGAEVRWNAVHSVVLNSAYGQIDFQDFKSFLAGTVRSSVLGAGLNGREVRATDYNVFVQDDWRPSPRWTVNLGVRYELDLPSYEATGRFSTFDPSLYVPRPQTASGLPVGPPLEGFVQAGNVIPADDLPDVPNVSKFLVKSIDPNNIAPRLGLTYSPIDPGRLVLRAGYGVFYSRTTFQTVNAAIPPTYVLGRRTSPSLADPFFAVPTPDQFPTIVSGIPLSGVVIDRNLRTPYFHQYNGSVQYEWGQNVVLEAAYVGTRGVNLFRQVAINQAALASPQDPVTNAVTGAVITSNTPANATLRAPFQGVSINGFTQNQSTAQSTYNSMQLSLTQRLSHGLQFLASYALARSIDNGSGLGGGAGISGVVNPGSVNDSSGILGNQLESTANRGVSDFDRTHRLVVSYVWDLPQPAMADRSSLARGLFSNWQISGIVTVMSGLPIDIVDIGSGSFYGLSDGATPLARPSFAADASCKNALQNVPPGYFFNPTAFRRPVVQAEQPIPSSGGTALAGAVGTDIGDVGRNCLRGPRQTNVDFALAKRVPIGPSRHLEVRAEFFNLFNHVNFANPISDLNAVTSSGGSLDPATGRILSPGDFGRIISTSSNPRLIQLAVRIAF
jgi:hypothetical protein